MEVEPPIAANLMYFDINFVFFGKVLLVTLAKSCP